MLEGPRGGTRVEEVLRLAAEALGVPEVVKALALCKGQLLREGATLEESGVEAEGRVEAWVGTAGGMPGGEGVVFGALDALQERSAAMQQGMPAADGEGGAHAAAGGCAGAVSLSEDDEDDAVVVRALFDKIDADNNGSISVDEARAAAVALTGQHTDHQALSDALIKALEALGTHSQAAGISWDEFRKVVRNLPRARGQRLQWVRSLRLDREVALLLKPGDFFDGLSALKGMTEEEAEQHVLAVCDQVGRRLRTLLTSRLKELRDVRPMTAQQFKNTKFSMDGSFEGSFASRQHFDDGPEKLIGTPNPNAEEGIRREHCERADAKTRNTSLNYNFEFFPEQEYEFVMSPDKRPGVYGHTPDDKQQWPRDVAWKGEHGRKAADLEEVMAQSLVKTVGLKRAEVVSLRLYTGPMYMLYNAVLRQFPKDVVEKLQGNRYETTIFCIISGVSKLSKATEIPHDRRVYRGLGGMILPDEFWSVQQGGFRGGIEWGLMSTTTNRAVAMQYSGVDKQRGTVFEITVGRVDIGADLQSLSQYPGEAEYLFPPLTFLEVEREPRVEGEVIVFTLRANINLKCLTLEQLEERRKGLHLAMARNLVEELTVAATNILSECDKVSSP